MTQFLGLALFCSVSLCAYYLYKKEADKVAVRVRQKQTGKKFNGRQTLVQDPVTGVYMVKR